MSLAASASAVRRTLRNKELILTLTPSGIYTPGGDTVNLNSIANPQYLVEATVGYPGVVEQFEVLNSPAGFPAKLIKGATLSTWALKVFEAAAESPVGTPLGLGPVSATSTLSAVVSGVGSVTVANTLSAGQFVYLNSFTQMGAQNGNIVQVASATATGFTFNLGSAANVTSGADTTGTYQLVEVSPTNLMVSVAGSLITNSLSTSTLLTMTQANTFVPGNFVVLQGLVNGATANGVIVRILTATTTGWTATWSGTSFSTGAETAATAQLIVTNAGAPVGCLAGDASIITNSLATASSAGTQGVITFTTPQLFNPGNLTFISGLTHGAILNGSIYAVLASGLTNALYKAYGQNAGATTSADAGVASVMVTGAPLTTAETTGELPAGAYPAACLADIFTIRLIGQKLKM